MTYEEFKYLALNPPKYDGPSVFVVTQTDMCGLPEHRKSYYPRFRVYRHVIGYAATLEDAEVIMRKAASGEEREDIYCFHINEYPLNNYQPWPDYDISRRLYSPEGKLVDKSWCATRGFENIDKFRGRPQSNIRFKAGDIVEVLEHDEVRLAVATQSPVDIDWCWQYRCRTAEALKKCMDVVTDEEVERQYIIDGSNDQAAVIDGPGYEYHNHIPTLNIMPLRFPISPRIRKRYEGYWQACQKQNEK